MKKTLCLFLALAMLFSLVACGSALTPLPTEETQTQETAGGQNQTKPSQNQQTQQTKPAGNYPTVKTPMTWDKINSLPIATNSMSLAERRQLCVDFFKLAQTFQWTPNETIDYVVSSQEKRTTYPVGKVYAGVPYVTEVKGGSVYLAMKYYDEKTGVLDTASVGGKNIAFIIGNHCSGGAMLAWTRVVNTSDARLTYSMTAAHGCIPVGPYKYDQSIDQWDAVNNTIEVCSKNGKQTIFESYAKMQPADGIVRVNQKKSGHVCMISATPVVVRDASGKIDGTQSYVLLHEQGSTPTAYTAEDGSQITIAGRVDNKFTFDAIYSGGYIPFTFAELIGTDPVEEVSVSYSISGETATVDAVIGSVIESNYNIVFAEYTVYDKDGKVLYNKFSGNSTFNKKTFEMSTIVFKSTINQFAGQGGATIKIECFSSIGKSITVYEGAITK